MLGPVIMKLQEAHGFTVVIDPVMSNVFFYDRSTDITDDVIQELQQQSLPPAENIQTDTPTP
jgi:Skp family chaperone for outer membrane proteins